MTVAGVLNISEEGLSLRFSLPFVKATRFAFGFSLDLHERIDVLGKIVWVDATKTVGGLRFVDLSQHVRERIRTWMNADSVPVRTAGEDRLATSPPLHASANHPSELGHADVTLHLNEQAPHTVIGSSKRKRFVKRSKELNLFLWSAISQRLDHVYSWSSGWRARIVYSCSTGLQICVPPAASQVPSGNVRANKSRKLRRASHISSSEFEF